MGLGLESACECAPHAARWLCMFLNLMFKTKNTDEDVIYNVQDTSVCDKCVHGFFDAVTSAKKHGMLALLILSSMRAWNFCKLWSTQKFLQTDKNNTETGIFPSWS